MNRHLSPLVGILFAALTLGVDAQDEVCYRIIPDSAISQYFLEILKASGTKFSMDGSDLVCYAMSDQDRIAALRNQARTARPEQCWNFDDRKRLIPLLEKLRSEGIPSWMEKPEGPVCFLAKDEHRVRGIVEEMPKHIRGSK